MKLRFQNRRLVTPDNLSILSPVQTEQLRLSGKPVYGVDAQSPVETLAATFVAEGDGKGSVEFWEVAADTTPGKVLYEVWVFDVDSAVVFHAGTTTDTGVGMIQNDFDPMDESTPELEALARAIQQAYDTHPPEERAEESDPLAAYRDAVGNALKTHERKPGHDGESAG